VYILYQSKLIIPPYLNTKFEDVFLHYSLLNSHHFSVNLKMYISQQLGAVPPQTPASCSPMLCNKKTSSKNGCMPKHMSLITAVTVACFLWGSKNELILPINLNHWKMQTTNSFLGKMSAWLSRIYHGTITWGYNGFVEQYPGHSTKIITKRVMWLAPGSR